MDRNIKIIFIGIIVLILIGALVYVSFAVSAPGSLIGGLTLLWAGFKSNILGLKSSAEKADVIKKEHAAERLQWDYIKEEYDSKLRALEAQMKYLDYKSALISEQLGELDEYEKQKIEEIRSASASDLTKLINQRYSK